MLLLLREKRWWYLSLMLPSPWQGPRVAMRGEGVGDGLLEKVMGIVLTFHLHLSLSHTHTQFLFVSLCLSLSLFISLSSLCLSYIPSSSQLQAWLTFFHITAHVSYEGKILSNHVRTSITQPGSRLT